MPDDYTTYTGREGIFGIGYIREGETVSEHDEALQVSQIARLIQGMLDGLGPGIYSGMEGSVVGGACSLTEGRALIADDLGTVPVLHEAEVLVATSFPTGVSYVHVQLGEAARADGECGYYISASAVPAPDALLVCKVTKAGGVVTAVDNSVRAAPAITDKIPWEQLVAAFGGTETLLQFMTAVLGSDYFGDPLPESIASRLAVLEAGGGGGGGGGSAPNWGLLVEAPGNSTLIRQAIQQTVDDAIADWQTGMSAPPGSSETIVEEEWDVVAVNELRLALQAVHFNATAAATMVDAVIVADGYYGHGEGGGVNFVDDVNSTF